MTLLDRTAEIGNRLRALPALPELRGERILLRAPREADIEPIFALFSDPVSMRWWSRPPMRERREAEEFVASIHGGFARRSLLNWIIAGRDGDGAIGTCTLYDIQVPHLRAGIGYALAPEHCGKGLASEAVGLALRWGFGQLGLNRIEADAHPENLRSRRLLERAGFTFEGLMRQHFVTADEIQDSAIYGLLAEEWRARS
jgi:[ribosomal protein S5]-alanine N-acetyltransferase